jgi:syntaxin 8
MATSIRQLLLLADHLKLSLLERQRAISLSLDSTKQDSHIVRSLSNLQEGIDQLSAQQADSDAADLSRLRTQYADLYAQYHGSAPPTSSTQQPNDPALRPDFAAAQSRPSGGGRTRIINNKAVRFRDNPDEEEEDPADTANRAALFSSSTSSQEPYRDSPPSQTSLSNHQIHTYHTRVLREQDEQLDTLGQSISRTRMIGIQMGNELDEQNDLLEDVEQGVDRHSYTLDGAQRRLGHIARKGKDNWNWITIAILVVILILVIVVLK